MATVEQNKMQRVTASLNDLYHTICDVYAQKDSTFYVRANAFGADLSYQWQISTNGGTTWINSGATGSRTAEMSTAALTARNGYMWRCVITWNGGKQVTSPVRLNVIENGKAFDRGAVSVIAAPYVTETALLELASLVAEQEEALMELAELNGGE